MGLEFLVPERPVEPDPVGRGGVEVAGMEARDIAGEVHHRPADPAAGVVGTQRDRVGSVDDPRIVPIQVVGSGLVADPVGLRVPEGPGLQAGHLPASVGKALEHGRSPGAATDDQHVELLVVVEAPHVPLPIHGAPSGGRQQPGRGVARAHRVHGPGVLRAGGSTGSWSGAASFTSKGSRASSPRFLYPRG